MPLKACMPVIWSIGEIGLRMYPPPSSPVIDMMPLKACRITS